MSQIQTLLAEMEQEAQTTRKMLSIVPDDKYDWKPHEKSMTIRQLATHIAEIPSWVSLALNTSELDFAGGDYKPTEINNTADLVKHFEKNLAEGRERLAVATDEELIPDWTMRNGAEIYDVSPKGKVIRMSFCQIVHHRAQLGVYLRLLNVPIPGSYGPSADEMGF
jgi:uncharacterized damage-inducible protein DinB